MGPFYALILPRGGSVLRAHFQVEAGLVFQESFQDEQGVTKRAGDHDPVEPGELVGGEVVVGDPAAGPENTCCWDRR